MPVSNLSDYNVNGSKSLVTARRKSYADLNLALTRHPLKNDIVPLTDIAAIRNSVKNLVLTNFYERPFQPFIAGNVTGLLFENADSFTIVSIKETIKNVLRRHEPRVDNITVVIEDRSDKNEYAVTVGFRIKEINQTVEIDFRLKRYR